MPDPENKELSGKLTEYGEGVFVTAAMMEELKKSSYFKTDPIISVPSEHVSLADVAERLDRLERLIKCIFDGHVLINGRFRRITP